MITFSALGIIFISGVYLYLYNDSLQTSASSSAWDLEQLSKPPQMKWLIQKGPIYSLEYQGLPYKEKNTTVFAYYATPGTISGKPELDKDLPGIILVHGGNAHADPYWVARWAKFGNAALSMDLQGCGPDLKPLPNAVPAQDYLDFDLNYHMVANCVLAHSLLISFKEINADHTAITGYSIGGQIVFIVASIDKRFKAAASVYGCGFLYENSLFSEKLSRMDNIFRDKWVRIFDPSMHIDSIIIPILFASGVNDPYYPLDSYIKTYGLAECSHNFCIIPGLPHCDEAAKNLITPFLFIDQFCKNGVPLPSIEFPEIVNGKVHAKYQCETKPVKAFLCYTTDTGVFKDRNWKVMDASIEGSTITGTQLPKNATAWLVALTDERNATVSSEVILKN
jgi:dienelactone hydrolase